jgi:hypothetical protein
VIDVSGDGRPEIVFNLYNDTGDGEWHTVVLDANDGHVVSDLPGRYLQGSADVDQDGRHELFLVHSRGLFVPTSGSIEIVRIDEALAGAAGAAEYPIRSRVIWERRNAAWALADLPEFGATWSSSGSHAMRHVVVLSQGGRPCFGVVNRLPRRQAVPANDDPLIGPGLRVPQPTGHRLSFLQFEEDGGVETRMTVEGLTGQPRIVPSHEEADVLAWLRFVVEPEDLPRMRSRDCAVTLADVKAAVMPPSPPVAARLEKNGEMAIVIADPAGNVRALLPPTAEGKPREYWTRRGRGMGDGSRYLGLLAAEVDDRPGHEVIMAEEGWEGRAGIVAYDHRGRAVWAHWFQRTPGGEPLWNHGALTFWWAGHFRDAGKLDVFVNTRRGPMHSDIGHLLDGREGNEVWTQTKATYEDAFSWGYAGIPPAIADVDGDGLDEIVSLYPVCFWIADGQTGELTVGRELASKTVLPAWAAYGEPMVHDFTGDGKLDVLLDSVYILALLDAQGNVIWHGKGRADYPTQPGEGNVGETTSVKHALCDFDGDGEFEIASAGYGDGVRAIDPRDGTILWSLETPAPTCHRCVAANVDGRGGDELLFPAGDALVVVTGDRSSGKILWTWKVEAGESTEGVSSVRDDSGTPMPYPPAVPTKLSMPAIADVDGDGKAEVIIQDDAGTVYCLDGRPD